MLASPRDRSTSSGCRFIRPGDGVMLGQACAEPQTLTEALVAQRAAFSGATLFLGVNYAGIVKPEHADHLRLERVLRRRRTTARSPMPACSTSIRIPIRASPR